ncbi:docking protein 1b [Conger conger]|uniref:docking protein 1b n=1 Tax=Conger conger TaxID=82655 RepID=UPI002A5A45CE|nr:docking protein 1b [Conger conger]
MRAYPNICQTEVIAIGSLKKEVKKRKKQTVCQLLCPLKEMDTHVKEGQLYVQHQKFGKKWKKSWFVLYPASQSGIARLEFFDCGGSSEKPSSTKKLDKKVIRLSECISILPALTETCPKDNMAAFCMETNDKTHVFATERQACAAWVDKLCEIAFQGGGVLDSNGQQEFKMAENLIYSSREEVNEFWVSVQRTEASERCGLQGAYWLKADSDSLILKDPKSKRSLLVWPYKLLRRYGRDKVMFSFEAGRRCDSGPGNFTFETKQGNEVFGLVEGAIREQKAQAEERHQSSPALDPDCPALQLARTGGEGGREREDGDSGGSKPGSADGVFGRREGRSLPDPPAPPHDPAGLYSEPADSLRLPPCPADALYSDPVDSLKAAPTPAPRNPGNRPEPLYSDIYDRVSVELAPRAAALRLEAWPKGAGPEHIYDEPEGRGEGGGGGGGGALYDEARLEPQAWRARAWDDSPQGHEVPYNPSADDYSVPAYGRPPPPRTKGPKPLPAPKPAKGSGPRNQNTNNNNNEHTALYGQVSRHKPHPNTCYPPDIIYDNLGDI